VLRVVDTKEERVRVPNGRTPVSVVVEVPRGRSFLQIKTDPAATSEEDAIVLGVPRAERTTGTADVRRVDLSDPRLLSGRPAHSSAELA
jgi:hypothetical protein